MAHAEFREIGVEPDSLDEIAASVGEHRHLAFGARALRPGLEDEGVVDRGAGDLIDALGLELLDLLDEAGQMPGRAGGGEGPRNREKGDSAALEISLAVDRLRAFRGRLDEGGTGQAVADTDAHGGISFRGNRRRAAL